MSVAEIVTTVEAKHNRDYLDAIDPEVVLDTHSTCVSTDISCD
jgi:hypothetical protein